MRSNNAIHWNLAAAGLILGLTTHLAVALVTVTVQPTNQVVFVGSNAVFNAQVTATGGETITGYTWLMSTNGLNPFITIPGATTATWTLTNAQTTNAGSYFTRVTYNSGTNLGLTSVSAAAALTVHDQARITAQPVGGLIRIAGTNVSFSVGAAGLAPLGYQWRRNGTNLLNNGRIGGANDSNLTISALITNDSGSYTVVVTNIYAAVTSQLATLGVFIPPSITVPPQSTAVIVGSNAVFSVAVSGSTPLGYQWQRDGLNLANGGRISGARSNVLTIAATITNDEAGYRVSISNFVGSVTSAVVPLAVLVPATFTSAESIEGRQGAYLEFTNTATGTLPIEFGAEGLPEGLALDPLSGVIAGVPAVTGLFNVTLYATNAAMTTTGQLTISLTTGVPGITSALAANGIQGLAFNYTITASNDPVSFSCSLLPVGMSFDPATAVISGRADRQRHLPDHYQCRQPIWHGHPGADARYCFVGAGYHQRPHGDVDGKPDQL